jgi:hypothetical protein
LALLFSAALAFISAPSSASFFPSNSASSPDGTQLAFVDVDHDGRTVLFVRSFSTTGWRELEGQMMRRFRFWWLDGRSVGFFALRSRKCWSSPAAPFGHLPMRWWDVAGPGTGPA